MTTHTQFVIDLETLGWRDSSIITRIAITPFKFDEGIIPFDVLLERTLYLSLDQKEQVEAGRTEDQNVIDWWDEQPEELRVESMYATKNDISVKEALDEMKRFLARWRYDRRYSFLWARNSAFECGKLQSLNDPYILTKDDKPVLNHFCWHDVKTINHILSGGETTKWNPPNITELGFNAHAANHDTAMEAYRMLNLWHQD